MLFRISKWMVVASLMLTLGFHWAFLQSVAWVGMMVNFSTEGSVQQAIVKTFDGHHPCQLCKIVRAGKKSEDKQESKLNLKKLDFFSDGSMAFYFPPMPENQFVFLAPPSSRIAVPLSPPPRNLLA